MLSRSDLLVRLMNMAAKLPISELNYLVETWDMDSDTDATRARTHLARATMNLTPEQVEKVATVLERELITSGVAVPVGGPPGPLPSRFAPDPDSSGPGPASRL